jgi:hypothetical protein
MPTTEKTRENRLRRLADRHGLALVKSRRRDPDVMTFGLYGLTADTDAATEEPSVLSLGLDEVEAFLSHA